MALDRITYAPAMLNSQPRIHNLRLTVRRVVEVIAICLNREDWVGGAMVTATSDRICVRYLPM